MSFVKTQKLIRFLQNCCVIILGTFFETVDLATILIMTAVNNVNINKLVLAIDKVVSDLNEYNLLQLISYNFVTFNLFNDNLQVKASGI